MGEVIPLAETIASRQQRTEFSQAMPFSSWVLLVISEAVRTRLGVAWLRWSRRCPYPARTAS